MSVAAGGPIDVRTAAPHCGLTCRAVRVRARQESWWRPFPHIVAVPGSPVTGQTRALAAALHAAGHTGRPAHDLAAATRGTALAILGMQRSYPTRAEVAIPAGRALRPRPELTVLRSTLLRPADVRLHEGIPTVVGPGLLRDLATVRTRPSLRATAIDMAHAKLVDVEGVPEFLATQPSFPGKRVLHQAISDILGAGRTDSPFEFDVRDRFAGDGVLLDRGQVAVPGTPTIHLDLGVQAIKFGIELNSMAHHSSRSDLDRDAVRANRLAALDDDWRVVYATWSMLQGGWQTFSDQVRDVISAQSRRHLGVPWPRPNDLRR